MKSQEIKKDYPYPKSWGEDDKLRFDRYLIESKKLYPDMFDCFLEVAVHHQIMEELGEAEPIDYSKIQKYEITSTPIEVIKSNNEGIEINA